jgi:hypothetical protein
MIQATACFSNDTESNLFSAPQNIGQLVTRAYIHNEELRSEPPDYNVWTHELALTTTYLGRTERHTGTG